MSELPNLIWVVSASQVYKSGVWSAYAERYEKAAPYVPASELEQAQDKLAEYGEEIARLRAKIDKIYKDMADARYDH